MRMRFLALALFCVGLSWPRLVAAQEVTATPEPATPAPGSTSLPGTGLPAAGSLSFPENGADLSGTVNLTGTTLAAWRLDFSYADDPTGAWFPLAEATEPVSGGLLATWDTTALTDGFYSLRLRVLMADGHQDTLVKLRIRNYSSFETVTPTVTLTPTETATATPAPPATITVTPTPPPSPTPRGPLPPNPASLAPGEILLQLGKGSLAVLVVFAVAGLAWALRRK